MISKDKKMWKIIELNSTDHFDTTRHGEIVELGTNEHYFVKNTKLALTKISQFVSQRIQFI